MSQTSDSGITPNTTTGFDKNAHVRPRRVGPVQGWELSIKENIASIRSGANGGVTVQAAIPDRRTNIGITKHMASSKNHSKARKLGGQSIAMARTRGFNKVLCDRKRLKLNTPAPKKRRKLTLLCSYSSS